MNNTTININAIEMESTNPERIYLPYNEISDQMCLEAVRAIADHYKNENMDAIESISDIKAYINILPYSRNALIGFKLDIITTDGQTISKRIKFNASPNEVMEQFFSNGAAGLNSEYREYLQSRYNVYKNRQDERTA